MEIAFHTAVRLNPTNTASLQWEGTDLNCNGTVDAADYAIGARRSVRRQPDRPATNKSSSYPLDLGAADVAVPAGSCPTRTSETELAGGQLGHGERGTRRARSGKGGNSRREQQSTGDGKGDGQDQRKPRCEVSQSQYQSRNARCKRQHRHTPARPRCRAPLLLHPSRRKTSSWRRATTQRCRGVRRRPWRSGSWVSTMPCVPSGAGDADELSSDNKSVKLSPAHLSDGVPGVADHGDRPARQLQMNFTVHGFPASMA